MSHFTDAELLSRHTVTPDQCGQILGIGKNLTYLAIAKGDIKTFRIGRVHKIPTAWLKAKLGLTESAA
jgi:hypothetical protein